MENNFAINTENLSKSYNNKIAVSNLSLKVNYGKIYGLLGPNGAGKTTTIQILNCIIKPDSGKAQIHGFDIMSQSDNVKKNTGYLPETPALYEKLTPEEYLEFIGELYFIPKIVLKKRIIDLLELFDLDNRKDDLIGNYSKGMKQKVNICAALIPDPPIIFLDEPTSNLDPASAKIIKDLFKSLILNAQKTIFLCTHLLDVAKELCDRIGIINNGCLLIEGTPKEIVDSGNYLNLEDAYLNILDISHNKDLLKWRS
ncbi:MAG: ABC transporter ATP-binding protein [Candidatus Lokiarchaeota archaeon]|nr:ABC transporter ATP-binding protein [Candidatus Lokiarchaeota archaeon]